MGDGTEGEGVGNHECRIPNFECWEFGERSGECGMRLEDRDPPPPFRGSGHGMRDQGDWGTAGLEDWGIREDGRLGVGLVQFPADVWFQSLP